ncbi:hypothetical protein SBV1_gp44 [Sulfolobales Beppu virus 1]|nr:hypothetical protein SBV1_gp44 [Sulfolobales Beppu virus 1]
MVFLDYRLYEALFIFFLLISIDFGMIAIVALLYTLIPQIWLTIMVLITTICVVALLGDFDNLTPTQRSLLLLILYFTWVIPGGYLVMIRASPGFKALFLLTVVPLFFALLVVYRVSYLSEHDRL